MLRLLSHKFPNSEYVDLWLFYFTWWKEGTICKRLQMFLTDFMSLIKSEVF